MLPGWESGGGVDANSLAIEIADAFAFELFAASVVVFVLGFLMLDIAQPIGGALLALIGVALALRLPNYAAQE